MTHEWIKMSFSYLMCIQSYLRSWRQNVKWAPTLSLICVDHSSHQVVVPGPLALPCTIWNFYYLVIPITKKFPSPQCPLLEFYISFTETSNDTFENSDGNKRNVVRGIYSCSLRATTHKIKVSVCKK